MRSLCCRPSSRPRRWSYAVPTSLALLLGVAFLGVLGTAGPASAAQPSADEIIAQMKAALEPTKPSLRRMNLTVRQGGEQTRFNLVQARKALPDGNRSLTVLLAPDDAKGLAYLVAERPPGQENVEWLYIPVVRRVRQLVPAENYTRFMDTDFSYADMGFLDLHATNRLLGTETVGKRQAYKVESVPGSTTKQWYFSRVVTLIDAETLLPIKREFYSPSNMLFKVESFDDVSRIDGVPTALKINMQDIPGGSSSEIKVTDVSYDVDLPEDVFGPEKLSSIADAALWDLKTPPAKGKGE